MSPTTDITTTTRRSVIIPPQLETQLHKNGQRTAKSALLKYDAWLNETGRMWREPSLAAYRDYLLHDAPNPRSEHGRGLSPVTVNNQLSIVRSRIQEIITDNDVRQALFAAAPGEKFADQKAYVDELQTRIQNAIAPDRTNAKATTKQDRADSEFIRLSRSEANRLIAAPDSSTLRGKRDRAMLALMLSTGLREAELVALEVEDLRQKLDGKLACYVRHGKGDKQRLVPYGELAGCLRIVDAWLNAAGITEGKVFRGFVGRSKSKLNDALSVRQVGYILDKYPVTIGEGDDQRIVTVRPHDLRRSYARLCYDHGMKPVAIQQNLGHADLKTTLHYIGVLDGEQRQPAGFLKFE